MARKDTYAKSNNKSAPKSDGFGYLHDKMDFDIETESLSDIDDGVPKITNDDSQPSPIDDVLGDLPKKEQENELEVEQDSKDEKGQEHKKESDNNEPVEEYDLTDDEFEEILKKRKKRKAPEKKTYSVPYADGTPAIDKSDIKAIIAEKAKTRAKDSNDSDIEKIPKVAKTFKLPVNLADDIDNLFRDNNGKKISGTKGMISILVSNAIVEYLVSQGLKDEKYLSNLQDFIK